MREHARVPCPAAAYRRLIQGPITKGLGLGRVVWCNYLVKTVSSVFSVRACHCRCESRAISTEDGHGHVFVCSVGIRTQTYCMAFNASKAFHVQTDRVVIFDLINAYNPLRDPYMVLFS